MQTHTATARNSEPAYLGLVRAILIAMFSFAWFSLVVVPAFLALMTAGTLVGAFLLTA
jgi:hypothetical protein